VSRPIVGLLQSVLIDCVANSVRSNPASVSIPLFAHQEHLEAGEVVEILGQISTSIDGR
jgi:hypothetical protein